MKNYQKLQISYRISQELEKAIDDFLDYINNERGSCEDCLRSEIDIWLRDSYHKLSPEQYAELKAYYVHGGIYKTEDTNGQIN